MIRSIRWLRMLLSVPLPLTGWSRRLLGLLAPLVALTAPLLQGCAEIDAGLNKAVAIKYAHVANVAMFQATVDGSQRQLLGVTPGSFWALFDICSIDVQGSTLTGFAYDVDRFFIEEGGASYGTSTPGVINVASVVHASQSALVLDAASSAFKLGPRAQWLPKQFYPNLKYRIAIFVRERPVSYRGDIMTLRYDGQPQVAALVQNAGVSRPDLRDFYLPGPSRAIDSTCP